MVQHPKVLTEAGHNSLRQELDNLLTVRRAEVAARIHKASESGGTVDNAEYDEAKNAQAFVEGRIRDLENILSDAVVAPTGKRKNGGVDVGAKVTVVDDGGSRRVYTVVGSAEAAPLDGKISYESPVGHALIGHKIGDKVKVETPSGVVKLKITKIH